MKFRSEEQNRRVPAAVVLRRFERSLMQLSIAATLSDLAYVYDNTGHDYAHIAELRQGRIVWCADDVPPWAERALTPQLREYADRIV